MLICPLCSTALINQEKSVVCTNNHRFDKARQGYLNLLPVQQKHSRAPGDNIEMVMARQDFLNTGHYEPIAKKLAEWALQHPHQTWADIGCGEGYYSDYLANKLPQSLGFGLDISKEAIKQACKKNKEIQWLIASMANIPLQNHSCDLIISIFSPLNWHEALRLLSPQGGVLRIGPHTNHLIELREKLYDQVNAYQDDKHLKELPATLALCQTGTLLYPLTLNTPQDRQNLLAMTPHGWRASEAKRQQVIDNPLTVTIAIRYDYFNCL